MLPRESRPIRPGFRADPHHVVGQNMSRWHPAGLTWKQLARRVWHEIDDDDVFGQAAKLSYYFLLAVFPLLLFLTTLFGYLTQIGDLRAALLDYFRGVVPSSAFQLVVTTLDQISSGADGGKLSIGILGTLWAASNGMAALSQSLNAAYEVKEGRPWWKSRLIAAVLTLAFAIFTAVALLLVLAGGRMGAFLAGRFALEDVFAIAWNIGRWLVALVLVLIAVDLLYQFAPDLKNRKRKWMTPGGIVAVALWVLVSLGFRVYLLFVNSYNATYGSLGALIVLMLWFYLTSAAVLIGAEVNSEIENAAAQISDPDASLPGERSTDGGSSARPL